MVVLGYVSIGLAALVNCTKFHKSLNSTQSKTGNCENDAVIIK